MTLDDLCTISGTQEIFYICWLFGKGGGVLEALFWEHRRSWQHFSVEILIRPKENPDLISKEEGERARERGGEREELWFVYKPPFSVKRRLQTLCKFLAQHLLIPWCRGRSSPSLGNRCCVLLTSPQLAVSLGIAVLIRNTPSILSTLCLTTSINSALLLEWSRVDGWNRRRPQTAQPHKTKSRARGSEEGDAWHSWGHVTGRWLTSGLESMAGPARSRLQEQERSENTRSPGGILA